MSATDIRGCIGCRKCKQTGKCVFNDIVNEVSPKFAACDGIRIALRRGVPRVNSKVA